MSYIIKQFKDNENKTFYGILFDKETIEPFIHKLGEYLGAESEEYFNYKFKRDGDNYYLVVLDRSDINNLLSYFGSVKTAQGLDNLDGLEINDIEFQGIGEVKNEKHKSFFIICHSPTIENYRKGIGLSDKNLYITLAFDGRDVFHNKGKNVNKNKRNKIINQETVDKIKTD